MSRLSAFSDLVVVDGYARFWKLLLYGATGLTILMSLPYLKIEGLHLGEYYGFILLALSGMMVMVSGADLLTIYLGTELMSLSLYVMAGLKRSSPRSLEASAKYFVLGAFSSGLLLYGISLLYGLSGGTRLSTIAGALGARGFDDPMLLIATILLTVGFGFKLAVVPFHMWTPDVYQGAPTAVTAFMAVASKAASFAAFLRVFVEGLGGLKADWSVLFVLLSVVTLVLGNVVAIVQTNIKRMLAYSSIAHAGYALIGLVAAGRSAGESGGTARHRQRHALPDVLCIHDAWSLRGDCHVSQGRARRGRDRRLYRPRQTPTGGRPDHAGVHGLADRHPADRGVHRQVLRVHGRR